MNSMNKEIKSKLTLLTQISKQGQKSIVVNGIFYRKGNEEFIFCVKKMPCRVFPLKNRVTLACYVMVACGSPGYFIFIFHIFIKLYEKQPIFKTIIL